MCHSLTQVMGFGPMWASAPTGAVGEGQSLSQKSKIFDSSLCTREPLGAVGVGFGRAMLAPTCFLGVRWGNRFRAVVGAGPYGCVL